MDEDLDQNRQARAKRGLGRLIGGFSLTTTAEFEAVSAHTVDPLGGVLHEGAWEPDGCSVVRKFLRRLTLRWNPDAPSMTTFDTELRIDKGEVSMPTVAQIRDHDAVVAGSKADPPRWGDDPPPLYSQRPDQP